MSVPSDKPPPNEASWTWWQHLLFLIASPIIVPGALAVVFLVFLMMPLLMLVATVTLLLYPEAHPGFLYISDDPAEWERREAFQAYRMRVSLSRRVLELLHIVPYDAPPGWHRRHLLGLPSPCPR